MKLSDLLASRKTLIEQAALANAAYAYQTIHRLAVRIASARLHGQVRLHQWGGEEENGPALTALTCSQSVIEEHFTENDLLELADALFFTDDLDENDVTFQLEELGDTFLPPLRDALAKSGVVIDLDQLHPDQPSRG